MAADLKPYTNFLRSLGTEDVLHSGEGFFAHLVAVYRDLKKWGCEEPVCLSGLFHSIYGTEIFKNFSLSLDRRDEVRELIGEHAEKIAYVNCVMDRSTFDNVVENGGPIRIKVRDSDEWVEMTEKEFLNLRTMHLCDWLEQVARTEQWDYRRAKYRRIAEQLGGIAQESYDRGFAQAPAVS